MVMFQEDFVPPLRVSDATFKESAYVRHMRRDYTAIDSADVQRQEEMKDSHNEHSFREFLTKCRDPNISDAIFFAALSKYTRYINNPSWMPLKHHRRNP